MTGLGLRQVEPRGIEPLTSALQRSWRLVTNRELACFSGEKLDSSRGSTCQQLP